MPVLGTALDLHVEVVQPFGLCKVLDKLCFHRAIVFQMQGLQGRVYSVNQVRKIIVYARRGWLVPRVTLTRQGYVLKVQSI